MGGERTEVKENLGTFADAMERASFDSQEVSELHSGMIKELKHLIQETDRFYEKKDGNYPKLDEESFDHLTSLYQNVLKDIGEYRTMMSGQNGPAQDTARAMDLLMDPIQEMLGKDLQTLSTAKAHGLTTLPEIVERARTRSVDISDQERSQVGGNLSQRWKISVPNRNGEGNIQGFFTEESSHDYETEYQELLDRTFKKNPKVKTILDKIDPEEFSDVLSQKTMIEKYSFQGDKGNLFGGSKDAQFSGPDHALDMFLSVSDEERKELLEGTGAVQDFAAFLKEYAALQDRYKILDAAGIEKNENADRRNSAMSTVADMLGMENLIARSEPMIVTDGEKEHHGTFMEPAKGMDILHSQPGDALLRSGATLDVENDDLKKQVADLQVLDYICGNLDRHGANMFYQIDDSDPQHPRLTGIQGIDNDCSFGTDTVESMKMKLPTIPSLGVISESTARTVASLDENMLKTMLRNYKFSDAELDAAWTRTKDLQDAIGRGMEGKPSDKEHENENTIRVVKDDEWKQLSMQDLKKNRYSYFATVADVQENAKNTFFEHIRENAYQEYRDAFSDFDRQGTNLQRLSRQLKKEDKGLLSGSRQYDKVMGLTGQLGDLHKKSLNQQSPEGIRDLLKSYEQTITAANEYLTRKYDEFNKRIEGKSESARKKALEKFQDPNSRTFKRMAAVSELVSELEKYKKQGEKLLKSRENYEEKQTMLNDEKKKDAYLRKMEHESKGKNQKSGVRISLDQLMESDAKSKNTSKRVQKKEKEQPQKEHESHGMSK